MAITRVKVAGWGVNEKLTSGQQTQLDINAASALDKRSGQTDTLASTVNVTGPLTLTGNLTSNSLVSTFTGIVTFSGIVNATSSVVFSNTGSVNFQGQTTLTTRALTWALGSAVTFGAADNGTNGATGFVTNINGQNCTGSSSVGGDLVLNAGSGVALNGTVRLRSGGVEAMALNQNTIALYKRTTVLGCTFSMSVVPVTFASPGTTLDLSTGNHFVISAANADTQLLFTNIQSGALYTITYTQDGSGGHTVAWNGSFFFGSLGQVPDSGANKKTTWLFYVNGTTFYCLARNVF